jgi:hypothetical protein
MPEGSNGSRRYRGPRRRAMEERAASRRGAPRLGQLLDTRRSRVGHHRLAPVSSRDLSPPPGPASPPLLPARRRFEGVGRGSAASGRSPASEPFLARLLERARAAAKRRRPGEPLVVEDRSAPPVEEYEPIRYRPPGRIISVR